MNNLSIHSRYLMVRRNDSITRFHEGFINYGFNKISYVESLRLSGYSFYLASKMYAFDLPHRPYYFSFIVYIDLIFRNCIFILSIMEIIRHMLCI